MRVGTMFLGEVESLDHESIQTKFFILGVPIAPMESIYVTQDGGSGVSGVPIGVHPTSMLAGYVRIGSALAAFLSGIFAWIEWSSWDPQYGMAAFSAVSLLVWLGSLFFLGRLSETEKARRRRLRRATGLGAPPELLPSHTREELTSALDARWAGLGLGDWRERLQSGQASAPELDLLYALAEYHGETDLAQFAAMGLAHAA